MKFWRKRGRGSLAWRNCARMASPGADKVPSFDGRGVSFVDYERQVHSRMSWPLVRHCLSFTCGRPRGRLLLLKVVTFLAAAMELRGFWIFRAVILPRKRRMRLASRWCGS